MKTIRIMSVFGTRPEAIKMCPLVQELGPFPAAAAVCLMIAHGRQKLNRPPGFFPARCKQQKRRPAK